MNVYDRGRRRMRHIQKSQQDASCDANVSTSESEEAAAARARAVVADIECRFLDMSS